MKIEGNDSTLNFKVSLVVEVNNTISIINEPTNEPRKYVVLLISHTSSGINNISKLLAYGKRLHCNKKRKKAVGKMEEAN
jgi:hypothetical protein